MGGTCGVAREGEGPQGVSFYFVSSFESLLLVGSVIHMQYIIHGLYFVKRNNEKDRFMFPWCVDRLLSCGINHTWYHPEVCEGVDGVVGVMLMTV